MAGTHPSHVRARIRRIATKRFVARTLQPGDASERYLSWFSDPVIVRFITAARQRQTLETLRAFIEERLASGSAEMLGIFLRGGEMHIGNIKFEPIDEKRAMAMVGVLIGDPEWRGRGVFGEVFPALARVLHADRGICDFWLGVERENRVAVAGYRKAGFLAAEPPSALVPERREDAMYMVCKLK